MISGETTVAGASIGRMAKTQREKPKQDRTTQVIYRDSPEGLAILRDTAAHFGRSVAEEIRLAVAVHCTEATLAALDSREAAEDLGDRLPEFRAQVEADLEALRRTAYRPERPSLVKRAMGAR